MAYVEWDLQGIRSGDKFDLPRWARSWHQSLSQPAHRTNDACSPRRGSEQCTRQSLWTGTVESDAAALTHAMSCGLANRAARKMSDQYRFDLKRLRNHPTYCHIDHCVECEARMSAGERETHLFEHSRRGANAFTLEVRYVLASISLIRTSGAVWHYRLTHLQNGKQI